MDEEKSVGVRLHACPDTKNSFWPITSGHSKRRNKFFRFRDPLDIPEDVKKRKNLKHCDVNCIHEFSRNLDDSRSSRTSDALNYVPKTSELLSCKKLIAEASKLKNIKIRFSATEEVGKTAELSHRRSIDEVGGKIISCQQHNKLRQLGNIVERSSTKEINNALSDKCKYSRDLLPMDLTAPEHLNIYSAVVKFEEQGGKCRNLEGGKRKSLEGIFSEKRHNIIKIAAENFSLQVNDLVSKGYNLIPDLLQRLGVANEPNNHYETLKMAQNVLPGYPYLGVESGSILQMPSEENKAVATILQGQRKLLEHFSNEEHSLIPTWRQNIESQEYSNLRTPKANTRNNIINEDWLKDSGRTMELFTKAKPDVYFKSYRRLPFNGLVAKNSLLSDFEDLMSEDSYSKHQLIKLPLVPFENLTRNNYAEETLVPMNLSKLLEFDEVYPSDEACKRFLNDESPKLLEQLQNDVVFKDWSSSG